MTTKKPRTRETFFRFYLRSTSKLFQVTDPILPIKKKSSFIFKPIIAKKIKEDSIPAEVVPGVFLGSVGAAHDRVQLDASGITHVLTGAGGFPPKFPEIYEYLVIDVADVSSEKLSSHFERCLKFIARALLDGGRVLVHCFAGRSRSSTVVAAYVMATEGLPLVETMKLIQTVRPCASPNSGFTVQLAEFEAHLSKARAEGRLLGRVQLDAISTEGINRLASVAVDAAAGLETSESDSETPRGEDNVEIEAEEKNEGKGKASDAKQPDAVAARAPPGGEKTPKSPSTRKFGGS